MSAARCRALGTGSLLAALTLWLWPLLYLSGDGESGADIGIGLFGLPLTLLGVIASFKVGRAYRHDRVTVILCSLGAAAGILALGGLVSGAPPYGPWLQYAIDHWYGMS